MNREIKFRAWNGKAMEYGGFSIHASGSVSEISELSCIKEDSPIMQFTGITDKNGKDIYEGDIVSPLEINGTIACAEIKYHLAEFIAQHLTRERMSCSASYMGPGVEIIGNIYENHELIE